MTDAIAIEDERECECGIIEALPAARRTRGFVVNCPVVYRVN